MVTSLFWQSSKSIPTSYSKAQDVPKSFTKDWERISLLWRWALTKALCGCFCKWWSFKKTTEAAKKSGSVPYSKRCQIWDKSQLPRFSSACWPTALCTELIIKWSMAEVRQTPAGLTPLLAGCEHFLHISQPHITHSPQSSGCCTSAPAQTVQPNSTQPWENKPS